MSRKQHRSSGKRLGKLSRAAVPEDSALLERRNFDVNCLARHINSLEHLYVAVGTYSLYPGSHRILQHDHATTLAQAVQNLRQLVITFPYLTQEQAASGDFGKFGEILVSTWPRNMLYLRLMSEGCNRSTTTARDPPHSYMAETRQ